MRYIVRCWWTYFQVFPACSSLLMFFNMSPVKQGDCWVSAEWQGVSTWVSVWVSQPAVFVDWMCEFDSLEWYCFLSLVDLGRSCESEQDNVCSGSSAVFFPASAIDMLMPLLNAVSCEWVDVTEENGSPAVKIANVWWIQAKEANPCKQNPYSIESHWNLYNAHTTLKREYINSKERDNTCSGGSQ